MTKNTAYFKKKFAASEANSPYIKNGKTKFGDKISSGGRALVSRPSDESVKEAYNKNKQADRTARNLGYDPARMDQDKYKAIRRGDKVEDAYESYNKKWRVSR